MFFTAPLFLYALYYITSLRICQYFFSFLIDIFRLLWYNISILSYIFPHAPDCPKTAEPKMLHKEIRFPVFVKAQKLSRNSNNGTTRKARASLAESLFFYPSKDNPLDNPLYNSLPNLSDNPLDNPLDSLCA